jgi:hypothetical protein
LRKQLPTPDTEQLRHAADLLDAILNHHTWLVVASTSLIEPAQVDEEVERRCSELDGFGRTEQWLETIVDALRGDLTAIDSLPWPRRIPLSE